MPTTAPAPPRTTRVTSVQKLLHALQHRHSKSETDRALALRLHTTFEEAQGLPPVEGLHFYVFDGAVSVYGTAPSEPARRAVLETAAALPGVSHVADHLDVVAGIE